MSRADVLQRILDDTRARLAAAPPDWASLEARIDAMPPAPDAMAALRAPGVRVIAEVKRRSPSAGSIAAAPDPVAVAATYARAGAAAISVLTEPLHFGGALSDLEQVARAVQTPCLRKDFVVERVQLAEARAAGASMALLIVAALDQATLTRLVQDSAAFGLSTLVEAHTAEEVRRALDAGGDDRRGQQPRPQDLPHRPRRVRDAARADPAWGRGRGRERDHRSGGRRAASAGRL